MEYLLDNGLFDIDDRNPVSPRTFVSKHIWLIYIVFALQVSGGTALMAAAIGKRFGLLKSLVSDYGADVTVEDYVPCFLFRGLL